MSPAIRVLCHGVLLAGVILSGFPLTPGSALAGDAPNVVILLADDLGWADVGYRGSEIKTPAIDRLAREGIRLERFYSAPICSPTRAALLTGRDPLKLGIAYDQLHPWYNAGLSPETYTLADAFAEAGYQTARNGRICLIRSVVVRTLLTGGAENGA